GWMLPKQIPLSIRSAVFALTGLVGGWLAVKYILGVAKNAHHSNRERLLVMVLGLFSVFYLSFVILATMVEANLSLTPRYAFPAYVTSVMLMIIVLSNYSEANAQLKWIRRALAVLFVVVLSSHVVRTAARSQSAFQSGVGFSSVEWVNSPTIQALQQLPIDAKIYSNAPDVITFLSRRKAILIPQHVKPRTGLDDPVVPYETQLENMRDSMETEHAYLVLFSKVDWRFYLATNEELTKSLPLATLNAKKDGQIYVIADTLKKE
ncbi:MAG: hypothetical protein ABJA10_09850, partial [Aestuariivirga sp.]